MDKDLLDDRFAGKFTNRKTGKIYHKKHFPKKESNEDYRIPYDIVKISSDYDCYVENIKKV